MGEGRKEKALTMMEYGPSTINNYKITASETAHR